MNLSEDEAADLFPDGRGDDIENTDVRHHVHVRKGRGGPWVVTVNGGPYGEFEWVVPAGAVSDVVDRFDEEFEDGSDTFWDVFRSAGATTFVLDQVDRVNRND